MTDPLAPQPRETDRRWRAILAAAAFSVTFTAYVVTGAACVGFDDAAELAYCASAWSVAHPPGFPAWVALGHAWAAALGCVDLVTALTVFSAVAAALAVAVLFVATERIVARLAGDGVPPARVRWAAFAAALSCGFGMTVWQWANAVEVYALQMLCVALVLFAVGRDPRGPGARRSVVLAGVAIGVGLSNHNVTMALFVPCAALLSCGLWRWPASAAERRAAARGLWLAAGLVTVVFVACHAAMVMRAGGDYRFEFGNPDSVGRLWHHVTGGFLAGSFFREDVDAVARARFYLLVLARHFWLFAVPALIGAWLGWRSNRRVLVAVAGYLALVLLLQLGRRHVPNMDSYLMPALAACTVLSGWGLAQVAKRRAIAVAAVFALALQVVLNASACDRSGYDAGDAIMADLDASAPHGSILIVTNWEQRMLYELYRQQHGFREDLIVVHSSLKGANHRSLAYAYPELFAAVQAEYEAFLAAVAEVDPDYVFTDYFEISTARLDATYRRMIGALLEVGRQQGRPVLMDRQTVAFLLEMRCIAPERVHPCGNFLCYAAAAPDGPPFRISGAWLDHPFLAHDLCAIAVLDNYAVTAAQIAGYYRLKGDARYAASQAAAERLAEVRASYIEDKPLPPPRRAR